MLPKPTTTSFLHRTPRDVQQVLDTHLDILKIWNTLTPLARNEWICWITIGKKQETRDQHLVQFCEDLRKGKRRPCCWPGCPHRRLSAGKWFSKKKV